MFGNTVAASIAGQKVVGYSYVYGKEENLCQREPRAGAAVLYDGGTKDTALPVRPYRSQGEESGGRCYYRIPYGRRPPGIGDHQRTDLLISL